MGNQPFSSWVLKGGGQGLKGWQAFGYPIWVCLYTPSTQFPCGFPLKPTKRGHPPNTQWPGEKRASFSGWLTLKGEPFPKDKLRVLFFLLAPPWNPGTLVELWWNPRGTLPQGRPGRPRSFGKKRKTNKAPPATGLCMASPHNARPLRHGSRRRGHVLLHGFRGFTPRLPGKSQHGKQKLPAKSLTFSGLIRKTHLLAKKKPNIQATGTKGRTTKGTA